MSAAKKIKEPVKKPIDKYEVPQEYSLAEIHENLRLKSLFILLKSTAWLVIGLLFYMVSIASLLFPDLLPSKDYLLYGRLQACSFTAIIYGFLIQLLSGAIIYILCKLNNILIKDRFSFYFGFILWNLGVLIGIVGILLGHNSGFEYFEIPHYSLLILFIASLFISFNILILTNNTKPSYFSFIGVGFALSLLIILSVVYLFLIRFPVHGAGQVIIYNWSKNVLFNVCISCEIIGLIFYFITDSKNPHPHSAILFIITILGLLLFGGTGGISPSIPVPRWIFELNRSLSLFLLIPLFSFLFLVLFKFSENPEITYNKLISFSVSGILLYYLAYIANVFTPVSQMTEFTLYDRGKDFLILICSGIPIFYSICGIILRDIADYKFSPAMIKLMYLSCLSGLVIPIVYITAGFLHGSLLYDYRIPFTIIIDKLKLFYLLVLIFSIFLFISTAICSVKCNLVCFKIAVAKITEFKNKYIAETDFEKGVGIK